MWFYLLVETGSISSLLSWVLVYSALPVRFVLVINVLFRALRTHSAPLLCKVLSQRYSTLILQSQTHVARRRRRTRYPNYADGAVQVAVN